MATTNQDDKQQEWTVTEEGEGTVLRLNCGGGDCVAVVKSLNPSFASHLKWICRIRNQQHNAALAAERENGDEACGEWEKRYVELEQQFMRSQHNHAECVKQLLAALAAIAEHNSKVRPSLRIINVDLSALERHVADKIKPLVDALEGVYENVQMEKNAERKVYDALAKVKE